MYGKLRIVLPDELRNFGGVDYSVGRRLGENLMSGSFHGSRFVAVDMAGFGGDHSLMRA